MQKYLLNQNSQDATATTAKTAIADIPPTPASLRRIKKRHQRTQLEMLQDQTNRYQTMDAREYIRKSNHETERKLLADSLLNIATQLRAQPGTSQHTSLQTRDSLKLNPDRGQSDRRTNETQTEWAKRMRKEAAEAERCAGDQGRLWRYRRSGKCQFRP